MEHVATGAAGVARASTIPLDGSWITLDEDMKSPTFFSGDWSWTSSGTVTFDITDFLVVGDGFEILDHGDFVASDDGKPDWSAIGGSLFFAPGSHRVTTKSLGIPTTGPTRSSRTARSC